MLEAEPFQANRLETSGGRCNDPYSFKVWKAMQKGTACHHNKPRQKFLPITSKKKVEQLVHIPLFMLEFHGWLPHQPNHIIKGKLEHDQYNFSWYKFLRYFHFQVSPQITSSFYLNEKRKLIKYYLKIMISNQRKEKYSLFNQVLSS